MENKVSERNLQQKFKVEHNFPHSKHSAGSLISVPQFGHCRLKYLIKEGKKFNIFFLFFIFI